MLHAKALFLVDDEQAQIEKNDILAQKLMCADDQVNFPLCQAVQNIGLLLGRAETAEHFIPHRKALNALLNGIIIGCAKTVVGTRIATCLPSAMALNAARSATSVLP